MGDVLTMLVPVQALLALLHPAGRMHAVHESVVAVWAPPFHNQVVVWVDTYCGHQQHIHRPWPYLAHLSSFTKPMLPAVLQRTEVTKMTSLSWPWKPSTERTEISRRGRDLPCSRSRMRAAWWRVQGAGRGVGRCQQQVCDSQEGSAGVSRGSRATSVSPYWVVMHAASWIAA
jgi:hypothetical protein